MIENNLHMPKSFPSSHQQSPSMTLNIITSSRNEHESVFRRDYLIGHKRSNNKLSKKMGVNNDTEMSKCNLR